MGNKFFRKEFFDSYLFVLPNSQKKNEEIF